MTKLSLQQRARSAYHGFFYAISERVRWSRGAHAEVPAGELRELTAARAKRIEVLRGRYGVRFERTLNARTSLQSYGYLDLLDRAWSHWKLRRPAGAEVVCDVGCANFWYAAALHAFFSPTRLVGVEVEGFRLYPNGYSRRDYAMGYVRALQGAEFVVADYSTLDLAADVVTAWFPFVTPGPMLAWRMPLSLLAPDRLFASVARNLRKDRRFLMVNHGEEEADVAAELATRAGLVRIHRWAPGNPLVERPQPPVMSLWRAADH